MATSTSRTRSTTPGRKTPPKGPRPAPSDPVADEVRNAAKSATAGMAKASANKYRYTYTDLIAWMRSPAGRHLSSIADMQPADVSKFIDTKTRRGTLPKNSTRSHRLSHLRTLFAAARKLGLVTHDPTLDISVGPRNSEHTRAVTDSERDELVAATVRFGYSSREGSCVTLALCGVAVSELAEVTGDSFDSLTEPTQVLVADSSRRDGRWVDLDETAARFASARLLELQLNGWDPCDRFLSTGADHDTRASSVSVAIRDTVRAAGLGDRPGIRPGSLPGWAGRRVYDDTNNLDLVCQTLGTRDRNAAARLICLPQLSPRSRTA